MRRIGLAIVVALSLALAPHVAEAEQAGKVWRIGYLTVPSRETAQGVANTFQLALRELGWIEGQNVVIDYRFADSNLDRLPDLAAELARLRADVIVAGANAAVTAVKNATRTTPIVMLLAIDPVGSGLVTSLARPGANITGLTMPPGRRSTASSCSCSRTLSRESLESRFSCITRVQPIRVRCKRSRSRPVRWGCNGGSWKSETLGNSTKRLPR